MTKMLLITTDVTTIFGRLLLAFRRELGLSQTELGLLLRYDRSLVARLETGRNLASLDNLHQLERLFIKRGLLSRHGDLTLLTHRVGTILRQRGYGVVYGKATDRENIALLDVNVIDRVVASTLDGYLLPAKPTFEGDPADPWEDEES